MAKYKEEVTLSKKYTSWMVYYRWGIRRQKTVPMTPSECLKKFKKSHGVRALVDDPEGDMTFFKASFDLDEYKSQLLHRKQEFINELKHLRL